MACPPTRIECSVTDDSSFMAAGSHFSSVLASGALAPLSGTGACDDAVPVRPSQRRVSTPHDEMTFDILVLLRGRKRREQAPALQIWPTFVCPYTHRAPRQAHLRSGSKSFRTRIDYWLLRVGPGGARRSISVGTAIEPAPFLPTERTAKKGLSL